MPSLRQAFASFVVALANLTNASAIPHADAAHISTVMPRRSELARRAGPPSTAQLIGGIVACFVVMIGIVAFFLHTCRKRHLGVREDARQRNATLAVARSVLRGAQGEAPPPAYRPRADGTDIQLPAYTSTVSSSNPRGDRNSGGASVVVPKPADIG